MVIVVNAGDITSNTWEPAMVRDSTESLGADYDHPNQGGSQTTMRGGSYCICNYIFKKYVSYLPIPFVLFKYMNMLNAFTNRSLEIHGNHPQLYRFPGLFPSKIGRFAVVWITKLTSCVPKYK